MNVLVTVSVCGHCQCKSIPKPIQRDHITIREVAPLRRNVFCKCIIEDTGEKEWTGTCKMS